MQIFWKPSSFKLHVHTPCQVHLTARLRFSKSGIFYIELDKPSRGTFCRFTRRLGSHSFLHVKIDKDTTYKGGNRLIQFFQRPFVIGSHVFRAFYAKASSALLFRTNHTVHTTSGTALIVHEPRPYDLRSGGGVVGPKLSLSEFLQWHNNISLNCKHTGEGKVPAELIMTDGCGLANRDFFEALQNQFKWSSFPTAVQVRINGAKVRAASVRCGMQAALTWDFPTFFPWTC